MKTVITMISDENNDRSDNDENGKSSGKVQN